MNMKKYVFLICSILLFLFAGCDRSSDVTTYEELALDVVSSDVVFTAAGGTGSIVVGHAGAISAVSNASWCTVSVNGQRVTVNVPVYTDMSSRHALVTLTDGTYRNFVTVSQSGFDFILEKYDATIRATGGEIRIGYESEAPPTVSSPENWITGTIDHAQRQVVLTVAPYSTPNIKRQADVTVSVGVQANTITVVQNGYIPSYSGFLGTYTMTYASSNALPANRTLSSTVRVEAAGDGASYYLKGILAPEDEALCNLKAIYDADLGFVLKGHIMMVRPETTTDFWWLPYSMPIIGNYVSRSELGMYSADFVIDDGKGVVSFDLVEDGSWSGYGHAGFILRNYDGATSLGNVNGADGVATFFYPAFEKQ